MPTLYDYPKYYDLVFGSDWKAEFDFLEDVFEKDATLVVKRLFEPACGTGRLLYRFGKVGYEVAGNDLNAKAVDYCNKRLVRHGLPATAEVGDMSRFRLRKKADAMFNTINSFRHLGSEEAARGHLECVAAGLRKGGVYVLGMHLKPTAGPPECDEEHWAAQRGHLCVLSDMRTLGIDPRKRIERVQMEFTVCKPTGNQRLVNCIEFRTYTARQMADLIASVPDLEIAATYDFAYRVDQPVKIGGATEDVVYVLRKR
ncbi:dTDP-3-amino-3,4,6-trideoxy-alpha-D-glucopyranose [Pirellulimonas nuda]|uniref:dTDP-3-amino-3,4, 6-trideoxy-alpha-D-glucopyranose n=1 Tax=Pirellulimonas nuda TaxID=2528009 RepID=A0A518D659_9BACT|nr:class I SAM-dependent methyltransferase [Pirellulimonas nuda]QDU86958.1 dTDP-3-amino-3,4,6-trideoxy-alpha-D-glucopyranose [Pirellulimonas nuda]